MPKRKDENELAKSLIDDIIAETESEDWNKEKKRTIEKDAPKTSKIRKQSSITSTDSRR